MEMWFYNNTSDERYLNKVINELPNTRQSNVYLKDKTNLVDPIIILDFIPQQSFNYAWLSEFNRYYYVREVEYYEGQYYVTLHVDVLMSFKQDINKTEVIAERSKNLWDMYIQDDELIIDQYTCDRLIPFDNQPFSESTCKFILALLGS